MMGGDPPRLHVRGHLPGQVNDVLDVPGRRRIAGSMVDTVWMARLPSKECVWI